MGKHDGVTLMVGVPLLFRGGICKILESEKDIEIVAEASVQEEIILFVEQKKPDVLFIDTAIPNLDIVKILESVEENSPETKVILLSRTRNEGVIINAISSGVLRYLTATSDARQLIKAIRAISKEGIWAEKKIITRYLIRSLRSGRGRGKLGFFRN